MNRIAILAAGALVAGATSALAVDTDQVRKGRAFARAVCAECHATAPDDLNTVVSAAPSFESIANTPGMTATALSAHLQTSHPTMPNLVLEAEDRSNVIAYILSLKWP